MLYDFKYCKKKFVIVPNSTELFHVPMFLTRLCYLNIIKLVVYNNIFEDC